MKTVKFNKIFILESLALKIGQDDLAAVGANLYRSINDKISELRYTDSEYKNLSCEHIKIKGRDSWAKTFSRIIEECKKDDCKPIIHLVCHGEDKAVILADSDGASEISMPWEDLLNYFEAVNLMCCNHLLVTMCVCHGFWSMTHILDEHHRIPFCGLLSSPDTVSAEEVSILLPAFYTTLFKEGNVHDAMKKLDKAADYLIEEGGTIARWFFNFTDKEFVKAAYKDYEKRSSLHGIRKMAKKTFRELGYKRVSERMIKKYLGNNFRRVPFIYTALRDYKFMFDIYPQERDRFDLPETYDELRFLDLGPIEEDYGDLMIIKSTNRK